MNDPNKEKSVININSMTRRKPKLVGKIYFKE